MPVSILLMRSVPLVDPALIFRKLQITNLLYVLMQSSLIEQLNSKIGEPENVVLANNSMAAAISERTLWPGGLSLPPVLRQT